MLLSVVCAGVGICKCITDGRTLGEILPFYIVSFLGLYIYFSVSTMVNVKGKKRVLKVNLVDYLENHFSARIGVTERDMEMLYGSARRSGRGRGERISATNPQRTVELMPIGNRIAVSESMEYVEKAEEARTRSATTNILSGEELETLLKEFLTV